MVVVAPSMQTTSPTSLPPSALGVSVPASELGGSV
jgi:hypothetical protein